MGVVGVVKRITVSLSEENVEWMDDRDKNRSAFIDSLLDEARTGTGEHAVREYRLRQLQTEREAAAAKLDAVEDEIGELREQIERSEEERREIAREAVDVIGVEPSYGHDNDAAETWAEKAGMEPAAFWELYTEVYTNVHSE